MEIEVEQETLRSLVLEAIRSGNLSIDVLVEARHGQYGSGDGVRGTARFCLFGETIEEGSADDYISVAAL